MSALAHRIELQGIATTVVGLVRPHLEKSKAPRSLFVPFQLGRPLGEPSDAKFQRQVLMHALNLLGRTDGPVILDSFRNEAPGRSDTPAWRSAVQPQPVAMPGPDDVQGWAETLAGELERVAPHYDRAARRRGRTTLGISQQQPVAWPDYASTFLGGAEPLPPPGLPTAAVALRFLCDDLKAYYSEAAQADDPAPSSRQIDAWFWGETVAGALLQRLRKAGIASDSNALKTVAGRFFVPGPHVRD